MSYDYKKKKILSSSLPLQNYKDKETSIDHNIIFDMEFFRRRGLREKKRDSSRISTGYRSIGGRSARISRAPPRIEGVGRVEKKGNFEFFVDYRGRDRGGGRDLTWFAERGDRGKRAEDG